MPYPVVPTRPVTESKGFYVNRIFVPCVLGPLTTESRFLLDLRFTNQQNLRGRYRIREWPNPVPIWYDRSARHRAIWSYSSQIRRGARVSVVGKGTT